MKCKLMIVSIVSFVCSPKVKSITKTEVTKTRSTEGKGIPEKSQKIERTLKSKVRLRNNN